MPFKFFKIERYGRLVEFLAYDPECDSPPAIFQRGEVLTHISAEEFEALIIEQNKIEPEWADARRRLFEWETGLQPTF